MVILKPNTKEGKNRRPTYRVTSVRENQEISKSRYQIRESQGKSTFLEKIREKSGNFIMNQGKNQAISLYYLLEIF